MSDPYTPRANTSFVRLWTSATVVAIRWRPVRDPLPPVDAVALLAESARGREPAR